MHLHSNFDTTNIRIYHPKFLQHRKQVRLLNPETRFLKPSLQFGTAAKTTPNGRTSLLRAGFFALPRIRAVGTGVLHKITAMKGDA